MRDVDESAVFINVRDVDESVVSIEGGTDEVRKYSSHDRVGVAGGDTVVTTSQKVMLASVQ